MSALPPLERAAWEALRQWAASAFCLDSETPEDAARNVTAAITTLLAAEPECQACNAHAETAGWGNIAAPPCEKHQPPPAPYGATGEPDLLCFNCGRKWEDGHVCYPAAPAPDAELERRSQRGPGGKPVSELERLFGIAWELGRAAGESGKPYSQEALSEYALLWTEVEHEVQRREAAARGEVVGTAVLCKNLGSPILVNIHVEPGVTGPHSGIPVTLTRRAES